MTTSNYLNDVPPEELIGVTAQLDALEKQLTQHAEHESHYPEVAKVFSGLREDVRAVIESIRREDTKTEPASGAATPESKHPHK